MGGVKVTDNFVAPAGVYKVKFAGFTSKDDSGTPVAKATDWGLKVYANLSVMEGKLEGESLPLSMDLEDQLASWCFLFSGIPPKSSDLAAIEKQMKTNRDLQVRVNDKGWVQGVFVPKATYLGKFTRFGNRDENSGLPTWVTKEFNGEKRQMTHWGFEILAGELTGVRVPGSCRYAIRNRGNEMEIQSKSNFYSWTVACGVDYAKVPDFADPENVLPELEAIMQQSGRIVSLQVGENGWVSGGQTAVSPAPAGVTIAERPKVQPPQTNGKAPSDSQAAPKADSKGDPKAGLDATIKAKAKELGYGDAFDGEGKLTDAGKKFASEKIAPICVDKGIPRAFAKMTPAQMTELATALAALGNGGSSGEESF